MNIKKATAKIYKNIYTSVGICTNIVLFSSTFLFIRRVRVRFMIRVSRKRKLARIVVVSRDAQRFLVLV